MDKYITLDHIHIDTLIRVCWLLRRLGFEFQTDYVAYLDANRKAIYGINIAFYPGCSHHTFLSRFGHPVHTYKSYQ